MAYSVPNTGGTAAPRGGPTSTEGMKRGGGNVTGGERRYWNTRTNKMETAKAMRGVNHPNVRVSAASKALGAPTQHAAPKAAAPAPAKAKSAYLGGEIVDPLGLLSRAQKQSMAYGIRGQEEGEKAVTQKPYQQRAQEITNTQGLVSNRISGLNTQNNTFMSGLIAGQEGSAKTANNFAAENALSAQKAVETAGQNAITSTGGELSPALRGQLQGQTNLAATQERGEAGVQAMRTLAAAAAAQGQAGLTAANERFAGEEGKNRAQENTALERIAAKGKAERVELPQKEYADILAQQKLQSSNTIAQAKLGQGQQKLNLQASSTASQNARRAAQTAGEGQKLKISAEELNRRWAETNNKKVSTEAHNQYLNASLADKTAVSNANIKYKEESLKQKAEANWAKLHGAGAAKPQQQEKFRSEFGKALAAFEESWASGKYNPQAVRTGLGVGYIESSVGKRPTKLNVGRVTDPLAIQVAEEVIGKHLISPNTRKALEAAGLPGSGWSEYLKRGR